MTVPTPEAQKEINASVRETLVELARRVGDLEDAQDAHRVSIITQNHDLVDKFSSMLDEKFSAMNARMDAKEKEQDARIQALENKPKDEAYARQSQLIKWLLGLVGIALAPYILEIIQRIIAV